MMLTAKSGMPLRVYDYLEGEIFMGALLRTEHVSGREGAATCSQFWRASEAASLVCNVLCSPFSLFLQQTYEVGREPSALKWTQGLPLYSQGDVII